MTEVKQKKNGETKAMRWIARILALVAVGLFVFFAVEMGAKVFPTLSWGPQGIPLLVALVVALAGVLIAWRWELVGGVMTVAGVAAIIALVCLGSGSDMFYCAFLFTLPLLLAGGLFLACCWRSREPKVAQES
jgi:peptidoglycan/LPS O-acetylase OafA/YrhL